MGASSVHGGNEVVDSVIGRSKRYADLQLRSLPEDDVAELTQAQWEPPTHSVLDERSPSASSLVSMASTVKGFLAEDARTRQSGRRTKKSYSTAAAATSLPVVHGSYADVVKNHSK